MSCKVACVIISVDTGSQYINWPLDDRPVELLPLHEDESNCYLSGRELLGGRQVTNSTQLNIFVYD